MSKVLGIALFSLGMALASASSSAQVGQTLALVGGTVYASPTTAPLKDAVVIVSGGTISTVGSRSKTPASLIAPAEASLQVSGIATFTSLSPYGGKPLARRPRH